LVPVSFPSDVTQAGARITGAAITPETRDGRAGYRIALSTGSLSLTKNGTDRFYWMVLFDGAGAVISEWLTEPSTFDDRPRDETLSAESADQTVRASMIRRWAGQGVGESSIYAPVSLTVTFGGATYLIDAWDALDYTNTHHNWNDDLVAKQNGLTFTWTIRYEGWPLTHRLKVVRDSDGSVVLPETILNVSQ
jgi:hypothetical protein